MSGSKNIRMVLRYDGTCYHGWQSQKSDPTIQDLLEEKIRLITTRPVRLLAAGRTDAGVHALHQVCHFHTESNLTPESLRAALNSMLPKDIYISMAEYAPPDFHARYSTVSKTYQYRLLNRVEPDPFLRFHTWHIPSPLNFKEMEKCLPPLVGQHDFSSFMSSGSSIRNPVRQMLEARMYPTSGDLLFLEFRADGFLRHMVRNLVGTLVEVGKGRWDFERFIEIFRAGDRRMAGIKAPAQGLFLKMVYYAGD